MSPLALNKEYSWLKHFLVITSGVSPTFQNNTVSKASHFPRYMSLKQTELFHQEPWDTWSPAPTPRNLWCSRLHRPFPGDNRFLLLQDLAHSVLLCGRRRELLKPQACLGSGPSFAPCPGYFPSFRQVPLWAMELFRALDMTMAKVLFILINMQGLVNIFLPPIWLEK